MQGVTRTGVTLQTMHPQHFDQGTIIDQTLSPGIVHSCQTVDELSSFLGPLSADMLLRALKSHTYLPPYPQLKPESHKDRASIRAAPKISRADSHLDWRSWGAEEILRKQKAIGPLWNSVEVPGSQTRRIIWSTGFHQSHKTASQPPGLRKTPLLVNTANAEEGVCFRTFDGSILQCDTALLDGERQKSSRSALQSLLPAKATHLTLGDLRFN